MEKSKQKKDLLLNGPIMQVILVISGPLMVNNLVRTFYTVADGLYLARLSAEDFAASAFTWPLNFFFISFGMGIGIAATALIAQYLGGRQHHNAQDYADNTLALTLVSGIVTAVVGYFASNFLLTWMGATGSFLEKADIYLKISFIGIIFDFLFFTYQGVLNAQGNTRTITQISAISMVTNIVLDPIFIYERVPFVNWPGLNWGIAGAAWATVISKVVLVWLAHRVTKDQSTIDVKLFHWKWQPKTINHILRIAMPSALGYGGSALGFTVLNALITAYGTNTLAAFSMVNRISDIVMQPQMGVGMALTSIIGQNLGAGLYERSRKIFQQARWFIIFTSLLASALIMFFPDQILSIFIKSSADLDLWTQAREYLNYTAFIIFFMGLFAAFNGFFQASGRTKYSMYMTVGRLWVIRLPIIYLFKEFTDLGSSGIWISMLISNMLIVFYGYYIYYTRDWKLEDKVV